MTRCGNRQKTRENFIHLKILSQLFLTKYQMSGLLSIKVVLQVNDNYMHNYRVVHQSHLVISKDVFKDRWHTFPPKFLDFFEN